MKLSKYVAVSLALGMGSAVADEVVSTKQIQYFALVYGDTTYKVNDIKVDHQLKNGSERTVTYSIGTTLCVTSGTGLLVLKDSENTEHYLNKTSGCHTVRGVKEPTLSQKISRYIPKKITEGEASVSGITLFSGPSQDNESTSAVDLQGEDVNVYLNSEASLSILSKTWVVKDGAIPIKLQVISQKGDLLIEQLSNTSGFTYFATPAKILPDLQNASLIISNKNGEQLMHIKMNKGEDANWTYTVQD